MEYFSVFLPKMINFLLLILIGVAAVRIKIVNNKNLSVLSGLLLKIILPFLNLSLLYERKITFMDLWSYREMVFWQVFMYLLLAVTGIVCTKLARMKYPQSNVHRGGMVGGNFAFMVLPLMYTLFEGTRGLDYIPLCATVDTVVVWTLGLTLFTWEKGSKGAASFRKLWNPITGSILLGLLLNTFAVRVPDVVMDVVDQLGGTSGSLGMLYVGCNLALLGSVKLEALKKVSILAVTKLLLIPFVVYVLSSRFLPEMESMILMLIAGAPTMTTTTIVARQYQLDTDYAAEAVAITTACSLVTLPVLFFIVSLL